MKKSIVIISLIGLFFASAIVARAHFNHSFRGMGLRHKIERHHLRAHTPFLHNSWDDVLENRKDLNLSDEQVAKLKQLTYDFRTAQVDHRAVVEKARIELKHLKSDKSATEESVMKAIDNLAQAKAEMHKARYSFRSQMRTIFTAKQLEQLKEFRREHRSKLRHMGPTFEREVNFNGDSDI